MPKNPDAPDLHLRELLMYTYIIEVKDVPRGFIPVSLQVQWIILVNKGSPQHFSQAGDER
jgi:hypothetical protein